jgi:predicted lactoylglutathione lyase
VGYGKVPDEYSIELKQENKVLRKMIYSLSKDSKEQVDEFIAIAVALKKELPNG